jgi:hypothetical protein
MTDPARAADQTDATAGDPPATPSAGGPDAVAPDPVAAPTDQPDQAAVEAMGQSAGPRYPNGQLIGQPGAEALGDNPDTSPPNTAYDAVAPQYDPDTGDVIT